jgi:hypothetical protein
MVSGSDVIGRTCPPQSATSVPRGRMSITIVDEPSRLAYDVGMAQPVQELSNGGERTVCRVP